MTETRDYSFVEVVLVRDFPTLLPIRSVWAKVRPAVTGSTTQYRRNLQIWHKRLDAVVAGCQELRETPPAEVEP